MTPPVLGPRELNRALLERQLLLRRVDRPVAGTVEHLLGLQAQAPLPPYLGLWSRLRDFDPHELGRMLVEAKLCGSRAGLVVIPAGFLWDAMLAHGRFVNNLLVDGVLRATWWLEDDALAIGPFSALTAAERDAVEAEARATVAFLGEARDLRFEPAVG
jgi:hypothetical protein